MTLSDRRKTALINASPKFKESASKTLLERAMTFIDGEQNEIIELNIHKQQMTLEEMDTLLAADGWVFAFPLYIDGIPSHLLSCLEQLEQYADGKASGKYIGAVINCGFYEGKQAEYAVEVMRNFSDAVGGVWSGGVGAGGGGGLAYMPQMPAGKGPAVPLDNAMKTMLSSVLAGKPGEDIYTSIAFPRAFYKMGAQLGWRQAIKANGGKKSDLGKRPGLE